MTALDSIQTPPNTNPSNSFTPPTVLPNAESLPSRMYENLTGAPFDRNKAPEMERLVYQIFKQIVAAACDSIVDPNDVILKKIQKLNSLIDDLKKIAPINLGPVLIEGIANLRLSPEQLNLKIDDFQTKIELSCFLVAKRAQISSSFFSNSMAHTDEVIEALNEEIEDPYRDEKGKFPHLDFLLDELDPLICRTFLDQAIGTIRISLYESGVRLVNRQSRLIQTLFKKIADSKSMGMKPHEAPFKFRSSEELHLK